MDEGQGAEDRREAGQESEKKNERIIPQEIGRLSEDALEESEGSRKIEALGGRLLGSYHTRI